MTLPTDTTPLYDAVVAALTTITDKTRHITGENLFVLGKPKDILDAPRGSDVWRVRPCVVMPILHREIDPQLQLTDRMRIDATVEIRCWYHAGDGVGTRDWNDASALWTRDAFAVGHALTYPGALEHDPTGLETGLDGGSLRADNGRHTVDVRVMPRTQKTDPVRVQVTHVFRASCELLRPTT